MSEQCGMRMHVHIINKTVHHHHHQPFCVCVSQFSVMESYPLHDSQRSFSSVSVNAPPAQPEKIRTVKVSNLSPGASSRDIRQFFFSSGDIEYIEIHSYFEQSQIAFVTFKDSKGAESAVLHSGKVILGSAVTITLASDHQPSPMASLSPTNKLAGGESSFRKAEDAVSSILAKGYVLSKGALSKARSFDERHQFARSTSAKISSFDKKIGLSEKVIMGASVVNGKVQEVDQKLQVSEKVKSAYATAGQTVTSARSAVMKNEYVNTGTSMVTGAFDKVATAAGEVGKQTKEKLGMAEKDAKVSESSPKALTDAKGNNSPVPSSNKKSS